MKRTFLRVGARVITIILALLNIHDLYRTSLVIHIIRYANYYGRPSYPGDHTKIIPKQYGQPFEIPIGKNTKIFYISNISPCDRRQFKHKKNAKHNLRYIN